MLVAVKGRVRGNTVLPDEDIRAYDGTEVIVTLLNYQQKDIRKAPIDWDNFAIPSERGLNVDEYMREMRENAKSESKEAFAKLEQLRRKGTITDDKEEMASCRQEKFTLTAENSLKI